MLLKVGQRSTLCAQAQGQSHLPPCVEDAGDRPPWLGGGTGLRGDPGGMQLPHRTGAASLGTCLGSSLEAQPRLLCPPTPGGFLYPSKTKNKKTLLLKIQWTPLSAAKNANDVCEMETHGQGVGTAGSERDLEGRGQGSKWLIDRGTGGAPGVQRLFKTMCQK